MNAVLKKNGTKRLVRAAAVVIAATALFLLGRISGGGGSGRMTESAAVAHGHAADETTAWTCSMHPQIKLPRPGKCPICFMDLIPLAPDRAGDNGQDAPVLVLSNPARKRAGIATVPAVRRGISSDVKLAGKVAVDETRTAAISSRVHGRIDRLYINSTGVPVRTGDHLAELYSPELLSVQQELLSAASTVNSLESSASRLVQSNARESLGAAREKMRLLGFGDADIEELTIRKSVSDHMTIRSTQGGVVIEKMVVEGAYVEAGMPLFHIADLSRVWIRLDAYESDLTFLRLGQKVEFSVEAFPGEPFRGTVSLIDPVVDPMTRTVKVRVEAPNADLRLKPEMFVRASVKVPVSAAGNVLGRSLRCPMHPEIVRNGPGTCDACGMPLEPAESMGYVTSGGTGVDPLVIPATAPLFTGERSVVYVETGEDSAGAAYEGRQIVLVGPRVGDYYVVRSGLMEGEKVVVNGAFRIDSELQIRARPGRRPVGRLGPAGTPLDPGFPGEIRTVGRRRRGRGRLDRRFCQGVPDRRRSGRDAGPRRGAG